MLNLFAFPLMSDKGLNYETETLQVLIYVAKRNKGNDLCSLGSSLFDIMQMQV